MSSVFGTVGALAATTYYILLDPLRASVGAGWFARDLELLAIYGGAGFLIGWVIGFLLGKVGREE